MGRIEDKIQKAVIKWSQQAGVRKAFPCLKLLYHIPNERYCDPIQGKQLKLMGVKSGVPDLCLPVPNKGYHGLYIELKAENGKVSDNQDWWLIELHQQGYMCAVCFGLEQAINTILFYLEGWGNAYKK